VIVLILCAGEQTRWGDVYNPKQLVDVGGEPLLFRTIRQVRRWGQEPVIVTHDERLRVSQRSFEPTGRRWTVETLFWTHPLWEDRTVVLLGDVIFTNDALDRIMACRAPLQIFGRKELRHRLVGRYYEIFGLSFDRGEHQRIKDVLQRAIDWVVGTGAPNGGKLRSFYELYCGLPLDQYQHENEVFYPIEDWTEDIDAPEDYQQFKAMIVDRGWLV
jgi:hypothetical protein